MPLLTGNQLRAARALVGVDQKYVADTADVAVNTIRNMEARGFQPITSGAYTVQCVQEFLEALGVEFLDGKQPGIVLREIWGISSVSRDGAEWGVAICREADTLFTTSIARAREMANDAERRGDSRTANNLWSAAEKAERDAKGAAEIEKSTIVDREAGKKPHAKKRK